LHHLQKKGTKVYRAQPWSIDDADDAEHAHHWYCGEDARECALEWSGDTMAQNSEVVIISAETTCDAVLSKVQITFTVGGTATATPPVPAKNPFWVKREEIAAVASVFSTSHGIMYDGRPVERLSARSVCIFAPAQVLSCFSNEVIRQSSSSSHSESEASSSGPSQGSVHE
jgi:hypothetical protein